MMTKQQITRTGVVSFGDASMSIWEDKIPLLNCADAHKKRDEWKLAFKRQVFTRIVQTLNRIGWTCAIPESYVKQYSRSFAHDHRECHKGELKGWLEISGRTISLEMWQGVNTPTRPDHGGKYESDKEGCMPYVLRLEMERTRRRIRDYLCAVFTDYSFNTKHRSTHRKPLQHTAMEIIQEHYAESIHFNGIDFEGYKAQNHALPGDLKSRDGVELTPHQKVFFTDSKGRWLTGTALYAGSNMWFVLLGKHDFTNKSSCDLYLEKPQDLRAKQNQRQRRKRLEGLMADAVKEMDFDRAKLMKQILWPNPEPLFHIIKDGAYFRPNYSGYTTSAIDAGKYTKAELQPYADQIKRGSLKAISVQKNESILRAAA